MQCTMFSCSLTPTILWTLLGFMIGFGYREGMKYYAPKNTPTAAHNINTKGRIQRTLVFITLIIAGIILNTNPLLLIAAGFTLFEVVGSWCVVNAMLGKNECNL